MGTLGFYILEQGWSAGVEPGSGWGPVLGPGSDCRSRGGTRIDPSTQEKMCHLLCPKKFWKVGPTVILERYISDVCHSRGGSTRQTTKRIHCVRVGPINHTSWCDTNEIHHTHWGPGLGQWLQIKGEFSFNPCRKDSKGCEPEFICGVLGNAPVKKICWAQADPPPSTQSEGGGRTRL